MLGSIFKFTLSEMLKSSVLWVLVPSFSLGRPLIPSCPRSWNLDVLRVFRRIYL